MKTQDIEYHADGARLVGYLAVDDAKAGKRPGIIVAHEGGGLTDHAKNSARRLAEAGYIGFRARLLRRWQAADRHVRGDARLGKWMADPTGIRVRAHAALEVLTAQPETDTSRLAAIGYCFGGTTALEMARAGEPILAAVGFHSGLATAKPAEKGKVKAKVLAQIGAADPMVGAEQRAAFEKEMTGAGVDWRMTLFGGVVHSFTNPDADRRAAPSWPTTRAPTRSWRAMLDLFDELRSTAKQSGAGEVADREAGSERSGALVYRRPTLEVDIGGLRPLRYSSLRDELPRSLRYSVEEKRLPSLPLRRAALAEGEGALDEVLGAVERGDGRVAVLALQRGFERGLVQARQHRLLRGADRHRAAFGDQAGPALGGGHQLAGRDHLVDEAELEAFLRRDAAAGEDHAHRPLQPDRARQAVQAAGQRGKADARLRQGEDRRSRRRRSGRRPARSRSRRPWRRRSPPRSAAWSGRSARSGRRSPRAALPILPPPAWCLRSLPAENARSPAPVTMPTHWLVVGGEGVEHLVQLEVGVASAGRSS